MDFTTRDFRISAAMKKVLIVEDHADMRELLSWQIELMGFIPVTAKHGKEGVEKAVAEKPQLILMDIMMPGMDGRETARALRENPETKNIPILAATALFRDSDLKSCLEAGCNAYIVKPFTFQELQTKLREMMPQGDGTLPS
jgi:two-component system alkaline phosphatase synthesis response regulator PhoP